MILAHVRERNSPAGTGWRLAAAVGPAGAGGRREQWIDLEVARRRRVAADPGMAHNSSLFRQPLTTLDSHLAAGLRVAALGELLDRFEPREVDDPAVLSASELDFGPPILRPGQPARLLCLRTATSRRCGRRRGNPVPEAWYRLPIFYFCNISEIRGPGDPVWAPRGSAELDYELEVCALVDTPARDLAEATAEEAIGGYLILNDWSAPATSSATRPPSGLARPRARTSPARIGPWLVTPDELADASRPGKGLQTWSMSARSTRSRRPAGPGPTPGSRSARCWPGPRPTSARGRATWSAAGRSAAAACSRCAKRPLGATSSRATR